MKEAPGTVNAPGALDLPMLLLPAPRPGSFVAHVLGLVT